MSRESLKTSSASLSKLEGVHPVAYSVGLIQAKDLKTKPSSRIARDVPYTNLETNPPLSSLLSQKTAWGSSTSIPDLIHQQEERKKQLQQKPPRRPWSGRKTPASSRHPGAKIVTDKECSQTGPKISVLGSQYQPQSRPPSGRPMSGKSILGSSRPASHGEIISQKQREDLLFEEFVACQEEYNSEDVKDQQIPLSPGHEIPSGGETEKEISSTPLAQPNKETFYGKPGCQFPGPKLLRKPTPEPIRLSMTIPQTNNWSDDEEEECQSSESCSIVEDGEDIEVQSVTSEVSTSHVTPVSHEQMLNHGGVTRVSVTPRNDVPSKPLETVEVIFDDINQNLMSGDNDRKKKADDETSKSDGNVTEILKERVNLPEEGSHGHNTDNLNQPKLKHVPKPPRLHSSSHLKGRNRPVPKVELDYRDEDCGQTRARKSGAKLKAAGGEVETMMSKLALNEKMDSCTSESDVQKVQESDNTAEYGKRTFQMSSSSFNKPFPEFAGRNNAPPETKLTTKTVEFSSDGIKENVAVSVIQKMPDKDQKKKTVFMPRSPKLVSKRNSNNIDQSTGAGSSQHLSEKVTGNIEIERVHSSVIYPMMINSMKISERPQSRMSHRETDSNLGFSDDERNTSPCLSSQEKCQGKGNGSPRSSPWKIRNKSNRQRPKSAGISTKTHDFRHRELQRASTSMKLHTNSARTLTPQPRRAIDAKRNREAVKSLRDGTLTSSKKYIQEDFPAEEIKPVSPSRRKVPSDSDSDSLSSSDSDYDIYDVEKKNPIVFDGGQRSFERNQPKLLRSVQKHALYQQMALQIPKSQQEEEVFAVRQKLRQRGVDVPFKILKRGLLSPSKRGHDECMSQLPETSSLGLLNEPEVWLGKVFRKYKLAEKALQRANERMIIQAEMEAKEAAKEKEMMDTKTKKTKRRKKTKGGKRRVRSKVKTTGVT